MKTFFLANDYLLIVCVCVCVCVCVNAFVCACVWVHVCTHVYRSGIGVVLCLSLSPSSFFYEVESLDLELTDWLGWQGSKLQEAARLSSAEVTAHTSTLAFTWVLGIPTQVLILF